MLPAVLVALSALAGAPPAHARDGVDIKAFAGSPGSRVGWAEPLVERGGGALVGAIGPIRTRVKTVIDLSHVDTSRVEVTIAAPECHRDGDILQCEAEINGFYNPGYMSSVSLSFKAVGGRTGPAGYVAAHSEPLDSPDPNMSDNDSRLEIDVRTDKQSHYGIRVSDVRGSVGDTVTVPVAITNNGPNTIKDAVISHPVGGGGKDFVGGDGCTLTPVPECRLARVPPFATRTFKIKFHIRRCYRPVPGDPEYGTPVDGGIPIDISWIYIRDLPTDLTFRISVNGCHQAPAETVPAAATAGPEPSPSPESSASPPPTPSTRATPPPDPVDSGLPEPLFQAAGGALLLGALVLTVTRLHRRRNGL
jgi:hypothetical protein